MTREERDEIVLALLNKRPRAKVAKKRERTERPADAKALPESVKEEKPKTVKKKATKGD